MSEQGGMGAVLEIMVSASLTAVTHVEDFEFPEFEKVLAEVTAHDSPGGYAEWIASGKRKLNEFKCTLVWDASEATHAAMQAAFDSDDPVSMSVSDPDGVEHIHFEAHISKLGRQADQEEAVKCEVAIQPTGQPSFESA